jgi:hypothetical protein
MILNDTQQTVGITALDRFEFSKKLIMVHFLPDFLKIIYLYHDVTY